MVDIIDIIYLYFHLKSMHFAIGTKNKPKSDAVESVLATSSYTKNTPYSISYHTVSSWVSDMPTTLEELRTGAKNRAIFTRRESPNADYFIGMEWWVYRDYEWEDYWLIGVVYIENQDGEWHFGYSCHLRVPDAVVEGLFDGRWRDIEQVVGEIFGELWVGDKEWSFGLFSEGAIPRSEAFIQAITSALAPHFSSFYR